MEVQGTPYEVVLVANGVYRIVQNTRSEKDGVYTLVPIAPDRFATRAEATKKARELARKGR